MSIVAKKHRDSKRRKPPGPAPDPLRALALSAADEAQRPGVRHWLRLMAEGEAASSRPERGRT